ncbi:MAG: carboxypeptidase-like regulatory domain-containing protein [Oscillospiraceae bacterium]|nr:carboxypeptidase-like regulatory domain-containing protein [Oscillospiraceae bacterium]
MKRLSRAILTALTAILLLITVPPVSALDTGVSVTGAVRSYNPQVATTLTLSADGSSSRSIMIASAEGNGLADQKFTFNNVPPGSYTLTVTKPAHATVTVQNITVGGKNIDFSASEKPELQMIVLPCGDLNGDGLINQGDLNILWLPGTYNKGPAVIADPGAIPEVDTPIIDPPETPDIMTTRVLSDEELARISSPTEARQKIGTVPDAVEYLNTRFQTLWHSRHWWIEGGSIAELQAGLFILSRGGEAGRSDMINVMSYLLNDNCDIGGLFGFRFSTDEPIMAVNYIRLNGEYTIFDPVAQMDANQSSRWDPSLPEATVRNLADYAAMIETDSELYRAVDSLYAIPDGQQILFEVQFGWTTLLSPSAEPLYKNEDRNALNQIKPENINKYKLSSILGGVTLSVDEAKALVGQSPAILQEKVETAGDLLLYMLASKLLLNNGDEQIFADGNMWHYNLSAAETLRLNMGNCGRMANTANYLLKDDYEEVGFVLHSYYPGNGGGHVYNYIKYGGKTYIVDFSSYLFTNYRVADEFNFIALDELEDYGTRWGECYGGLAAIIAHTSEGMHLPNVWEGDGYYLPEGTDFQVLFETPGSGYEVRTMPCPPEVPDWRDFD